MRLKCSGCGQSVDGGVVTGTSIVCPHCQSKLKLPTQSTPATIEKVTKTRPSAGSIAPIVLPVVLPSMEDADSTGAKTEDSRRAGAERQENGGTNGIGALGFALGLTTMLFLFSAAAAFKEFPFYLALASCYGIPASLVGLICSIIGCLRKGRSKIFSLIGVALGVFLILAALPAAFTMIKRGG